MPKQAHVVMVMADDSDYPSRVFESLIEAKAFAIGKQERSGTRVYVTSVPLVPCSEVRCRCGYTAEDDICDCDFEALASQESDDA